MDYFVESDIDESKNIGEKRAIGFRSMFFLRVMRYIYDNLLRVFFPSLFPELDILRREEACSGQLYF